MNRCDVAEYGEPDSDLPELLHDWSQIDLSRSAWLAFTPLGDLAGYAAVLPSVAGLRYMLYTDPGWAGDDLSQALLAWCERRGAAIGKEGGEAAEVIARTFVPHVNERHKRILEQAGFQVGKYFFQMQIEIESPLPEPQWPAGVSVRTALPGQDDRPIYELIEAAFDQPGRTHPSFETWQALMMRPGTLKPDIWFLALAGEELVGACLCFEYPQLGWVRQLGVAEQWRRQGIGAALLHHAFAEFKKRGFNKVGLAVESKRPNAYLFYQSIGMRQARQFDEYLKPLA
jgi:GNAT superfamily N-acetyltransferase